MADTGMMGLFRNLSDSTQHPPQRYLGVGIIQLVLLMVPCLMFLSETVKVVWFLGPPTLPPRKLIFRLMVAILCDLRVCNIHPWVIHTKKGTIIHHIFGGSTIVLILVMVEVVLILG